MIDYSELYADGSVTALYLDDCRTPRQNHYFNWVVVRDYKAFTNYILQQGMPKFISFDHDLSQEHQLHHIDNISYFKDTGIPYTLTEADYAGFTEKTGYDAAKWLVEYCLDNEVLMPHFTVHSANPAGAENILHLLNGLQKEQGTIPNGYRTAW